MAEATTSTSTATANINDQNPSFTEIKEGQASIMFNKGQVFYNNVQEFNRDLSVLMIKMFVQTKKNEAVDAVEEKKAKAVESKSTETKATDSSSSSNVNNNNNVNNKSDNKNGDDDGAFKGIKILEALSATGLRSIRYWKEIPEAENNGDIQYIVANDLDKDAVNTIGRNVQHNGISTEQIRPKCADANMTMYEAIATHNLYDVVDLDPYGTAAPFIDASVQSLNEGGLLCVTCTDCAVLCGGNSEACFAKYGSMPVKGKYCHEMAVRIVLATIQIAAARHKKYIVPILSLSIDFYVRMFVRVYTSPKVVKDTATKLSYIYQCVGCEAFALQPVGKKTIQGGSTKYSPAVGPVVQRNCEQCGKIHKMGGPIWSEPLHDQAVVKKAYDYVQANPKRFGTADRLSAMLTLVTEELPDIPLFYHFPTLLASVRMPAFKMWQMRAPLLNAGYRVSQSHASTESIKTDAPINVVYDVLRCYAQNNKLEQSPRLKQDDPGFVIMSKPPTTQLNFSRAPGDEVKTTSKGGVARYLVMPENWGPKSRAKKRGGGDLAANASKRKTLPCRRFLTAEGCRFGDKCCFIHEGVDKPNTNSSATSTADAIATTSTSTANDKNNSDGN